MINLKNDYNTIGDRKILEELLKYNDELIHVHGHDINCIPLNGDASKWWMFDEAGNKKYFSGIKDTAYKDFIVVESMGNGDSLLIYKNNELYFYSHDTNIPLTKVTSSPSIL